MKNQVTTVYKQAERFAEITKKAIITGNITRAKKCLAVAEQLFKTGSNDTKIAVTDVYFLSIATFMEVKNCKISNLFPKTLQDEYVKQIIISRM